MLIPLELSATAADAGFFKKKFGSETTRLEIWKE